MCGSNIYQISRRGYSICGLTYKTSMLLYPPPLRFSHFLILYFNSFFYLVGDLYFYLFFVIISSLCWSFLIPIRYWLKYKVFWLNYYVSIHIKSCITDWKLRFSLLFLFDYWIPYRFFVWGGVGVECVYLWESFLYHYWFIKFNLKCICNTVARFGFWSLFYIRSICHIKY